MPLLHPSEMNSKLQNCLLVGGLTCAFLIAAASFVWLHQVNTPPKKAHFEIQKIPLGREARFSLHHVKLNRADRLGWDERERLFRLDSFTGEVWELTDTEPVCWRGIYDPERKTIDWDHMAEARKWISPSAGIK
jgi:hypothetical protein